MSTSAQLEREADQTRAQIEATLGELRSRMRPGHVVDQLVDYARDGNGGAQLLRNLRQQVVEHPLPVAFVGVGLAWLMLSGRRTSAPASNGGHAEIGSSVSGYADNARSFASDVSERAQEGTSRVRETAGSVASSVADAASSAYGTAADRAGKVADTVGHSGAALRQNVSVASRNMTEFFEQQPLMLVGIGLALGSAIGAALPTTETEDRILGDGGDSRARQPEETASREAWPEEEPIQSAFEARQEQDEAPPRATIVPSDTDGTW